VNSLTSLKWYHMGTGLNLSRVRRTNTACNIWTKIMIIIIIITSTTTTTTISIVIRNYWAFDLLLQMKARASVVVNVNKSFYNII
jgi:hypothetical protein